MKYVPFIWNIKFMTWIHCDVLLWWQAVTALDRANADGALLPKPKVLDLMDGKNEVNSVANKGA